MPIALIIQGLAIAVIAVIFFRGARANDKNGFLWAGVGIGIFILSSIVIMALVFAYAGTPSDSFGTPSDSLRNRVLVIILSTGLPFAIALFGRVKFLPAPPVSSIPRDNLNAGEIQSPPSRSGSSRFLYFIPAVFSALWVINQFNLELLRTFVGRNFGPFQGIGHYMVTMGNIYDAMDAVTVGAWGILLTYLGYQYLKKRRDGQSERKLKILILVFVCFLVQLILVLG